MISIKRSGVDELVYDEIGDMFINSVNSSKLALSTLIKDVARQERKLIKDVMGVEITPQQFRENIIDIQNNYPALNGLTGYALRKITNLYDTKLTKSNAQEQLEFQAALHLAWEQAMAQSDNSSRPENPETILLEWIEATMNDFVTTSSSNKALATKQLINGEYRHTGKITKIQAARDVGNKLIDLKLTDLGPITQLRIKKYLNEHWKKGVSEMTIKKSIKKVKNEMTVDAQIDWFELTKGRTAANRNPKQDSTVVSKFKTSLKNYLTSNIGGQTLSVPNIDIILDYVFTNQLGKADASALFVGNNTQAIIGLCGEIQALCILGILLKDKFNLSSNMLQWTAKNLSAQGKQWHADIILDGFGVQVKNSVTDLLKATKGIDFVNSSLDRFLDNQVAAGHIDSYLKESIMSVYEAYYFNIPYNVSYETSRARDESGRSYRSTHIGTFEQVMVNPEFQNTRERIIRLRAILDGIFSQLIGELMYIGVGNVFENQSNNLLFFVGGRLLFASEILKEIDKELANQDANNFQFSIENTQAYNIVNFLQQNGLAAFNHEDQYIGSLDQSVRSHIVLTSSYNFSDLLNKIYH